MPYSSRNDHLANAVVSTLLFVPNLVDYFRFILLILSAAVSLSHPVTSLLLYILSASLDAVDGYLARKLNQTSAFGAWLDVVIDNFGRAMLWNRTSELGFIIASLEWLTFVCNHTHGAEWKSKIVGPWLVQQVMRNNFRSPVGILAIGSLHVLPVWLYALQIGILTSLSVPVNVLQLITVLLVAGRVVCAVVEIWCITVHALYLCSPPSQH